MCIRDRASTIHCSWLEVALRPRTIDGSATFKMELSTLMSNKVMHSTDKMAQRRPRPRYEAPPVGLDVPAGSTARLGAFQVLAIWPMVPTVPGAAASKRFGAIERSAAANKPVARNSPLPTTTTAGSAAPKPMYRAHIRWALNHATGIATGIISGAPALTARFGAGPVSYTHLRAHETVLDLVCRLL